MSEESGHIYGHKMQAYNKAAGIVKVAPKTVRMWVQDFEASECIADSRRGRHSKTSSPIVDDPEFRELFKNYVRNNSRKQGTIIIS